MTISPSMPRGGRFAALIALILLATGGCGPYIRGSLQQQDYADVKAADVLQRIILVGDAGDKSAQATLDDAQARAGALKDRTTVFFLGDNIYEYGLPKAADPAYEHFPGEYAHALAVLDAQIRVITASGARGVFLPGNHDWDHAGEKGLARARSQTAYVEDKLGPDAVFSAHGCPGPRTYALGELRVIAVDTQWLLHPHARTDAISKAHCANQTNAAVYAAFERAISDAAGHPTVVLGHHPTKTYGHHGYQYHWRQLYAPASVKEWSGNRVANWALQWLANPLTFASPGLFAPELAALGLLVPFGGLLQGYLEKPNDQDTTHPDNRAMVAALNKAMAGHAGPLAYAAGHDHGQQVIEGPRAGHYALVSGGASQKKLTHIKAGADKIMSHRHTGFIELNYVRQGDEKRLVLLVFDTGEPRPIFRMDLKK